MLGVGKTRYEENTWWNLCVLKQWNTHHTKWPKNINVESLYGPWHQHDFQLTFCEWHRLPLFSDLMSYPCRLPVWECTVLHLDFGRHIYHLNPPGYHSFVQIKAGLKVISNEQDKKRYNTEGWCCNQPIMKLRETSPSVSPTKWHDLHARVCQ